MVESFIQCPQDEFFYCICSKKPNTENYIAILSIKTSD